MMAAAHDGRRRTVLADSSFEGRVALVTGGGSGIGAAGARLFAEKGARVVVADLDLASAEETAQQITASGGEASAVRVDVGDEASVEALVAHTVERFGRLDAAMNNAGISDAPRSLVDFPSESWDRMIRVNLSSVFYCLKAEIKQMLTQEAEDGRRGAICNTSSGAGVVPAPGQPHYTAAKHGVLGLTKLAASEYVGEGIRTNAICPGVTETKMMSEQPEEMKKLYRRAAPGGEMGRPEDVAAAAVWLCSREARWVNGQSLVVDGGGVMR